MKKISCILLIDDNEDDNFFHERVIRMAGVSDNIVIKNSGIEALEYLKEKGKHPENHPDIIFLDINMPGMNGWEFLEEYQKLPVLYQSKVIVIMLTTSTNPDDQEKSRKVDAITEFNTKPLTQKMLMDIISRYFPEYS